MKKPAEQIRVELLPVSQNQTVGSCAAACCYCPYKSRNDELPTHFSDASLQALAEIDRYVVERDITMLRLGIFNVVDPEKNPLKPLPLSKPPRMLLLMMKDMPFLLKHFETIEKAVQTFRGMVEALIPAEILAAEEGMCFSFGISPVFNAGSMRHYNEIALLFKRLVEEWCTGSMTGDDSRYFKMHLGQNDSKEADFWQPFSSEMYMVYAQYKALLSILGEVPDRLQSWETYDTRFCSRTLNHEAFFGDRTIAVGGRLMKYQKPQEGVMDIEAEAMPGELSLSLSASEVWAHHNTRYIKDSSLRIPYADFSTIIQEATRQGHTLREEIDTYTREKRQKQALAEIDR